MTFQNPDGMAVEEVLRDPRCQRKCLAEDGRPASDSPATYTGRRIAYPVEFITKGGPSNYAEINCDCCENNLRPVSLKDYSEEDAMARFGMKAIPVGVTLYECPICVYDLKSASGIMR